MSHELLSQVCEVSDVHLRKQSPHPKDCWLAERGVVLTRPDPSGDAGSFLPTSKAVFQIPGIPRRDNLGNLGLALDPVSWALGAMV